jgi:hypothetical protein
VYACYKVHKLSRHDATKLLNIGADILCKPTQSLVNMSLQTRSFPNALKHVEIISVYNKEDSLNWSFPDMVT